MLRLKGQPGWFHSGSTMGFLMFFKGRPPLTAHVDVLVLVEFAQTGKPLSPAEREHLKTCEECSAVYHVFWRQRRETPAKDKSRDKKDIA